MSQSSTALLLDGMNVFDRVIKVNMARGGSGPGVVRSLDPDRVQRTVHVGGLPFDEISEETLSEYFAHVGEVSLSLQPSTAGLLHSSASMRLDKGLPAQAELHSPFTYSGRPQTVMRRRD